MRTARNSWLAVCRRAATVLCVLLATAGRAEVVQRSVEYPPEAVGGWAGVDFDSDGRNELSFELKALGHELGGVLFLEVITADGVEVLRQSVEVVPLRTGDTVSLRPVLGWWQPAGLGVSVWRQWYSNNPGAEPASPGRGVGMPGCGEFMGTRFLMGGDWHYGWVRFGGLRSSEPPFPWPSVLEYAFETVPNTPILIPEPGSASLLLSCLLGAGWRMLRIRPAFGAR